MGRTNVEHLSIHDFRACDTAGKMWADGWEVAYRCEACGKQGPVPLRPILAHPRLGPEFPMWDRRPPCRRCGARVYLWAHLPGSPRWGALVSDGGLRLAPWTRRITWP